MIFVANCISMLLYQLLQPILFQMEAERAHEWAFGAIKRLYHSPFKGLLHYENKAPNLATSCLGMTFPNPLGLAAGFDKNALLLPVWQYMGFGFAEIGTVTPRPQAGNPRPRLFRLTDDEAIINRMGFNNDGLDVIARRLENRPKNFIVGANIGKNKDTPNEQAADDYLACLKGLYGLADFFVINVSSPNTPGLRDLQAEETLGLLLETLTNYNLQQPQPKPLLLKIAPDLSEEQLQHILRLTQQFNLAGLVATNTTITRTGLYTDLVKVEAIGAGGLSGRPLKPMANQIVAQIKQQAPGITIIGAGGIMSPQDAVEKMRLGAQLIESYTGFVYGGPSFIRMVLNGISFAQMRNR
jgi:dihydroorotate dehydrogenase